MTHIERLTESERVLLLHRHKGLLQRVAERCGVHPSLVSRVFHGKARSASVEKELERVLAKRAGDPSSGKGTGLRRTTPIDRSGEQHWLADHRKEYAGHWVALDGYRLIASGVNAKEVFEEARRSGVARPLVQLIEAPGALPFGGW